MNAVYYTISTCVNVWACSPRAKYWDSYIVGGHCLDRYAIFTATAGFSIFSDIAILILPSWSIWQLRISLRKKTQMFLMMAAGLLYVYYHTIQLKEMSS